MPRGRGSNNNPANRFEHLSLERDADWDPAQDPAPKTRFYRDLSQSIIYCYQPIERRLQLTRACPAVLAEFRNPVVIITKNHLVTRDIDLLRELAAFQAIQVNLSINSLNPDLAARLELRASLPKLRLAAVAALAKAQNS